MRHWILHWTLRAARVFNATTENTDGNGWIKKRTGEIQADQKKFGEQ